VDQPLGLSVGAYLIDVIDIDDLESTFTVDFVVDLQWKDSKLADPASKELRRLALDDAWHPELAFVNEQSVIPKLDSYLTVDADGNTSYRRRFFGTFSVALKLADFPFDEQSLVIDMVILRYRSDEIVCSRNESWIGCEPDLELPGWHFEGFSVTTGVKKVGIEGYDFSASSCRPRCAEIDGFICGKSYRTCLREMGTLSSRDPRQGEQDAVLWRSCSPTPTSG
jgi:hypothetical protein